jgi:hypothetical protein
MDQTEVTIIGAGVIGLAGLDVDALGYHTSFPL